MSLNESTVEASGARLVWGAGLLRSRTDRTLRPVNRPQSGSRSPMWCW
jgi:hypothetical protein